jgi:L-asparaginase
VAIRAFVEAGAAGIVNASLAPGRVSPAEDAAIADAIERGLTVVRSSRVQTGRILAGEAMDREGLIAADDLNPQKARILTMLALAVTRDREEIRRIFSRY